MGTNLSQVFIANADLNDGGAFNALTSAKVGVYDLATGAYTASTALYADANINATWAYRNIQFAQGTATNPIATPLIDTRDIRAIKYEKHAPSVRAAQVTGTLVANKEYNVKFIIRNTPVNQLNFRDDSGSELTDLSGAGKQFPLGVFNTTNHKALNISATGATATAAGDNLVANIAASPILNDLFTASNSSGVVTITARHATVVFEMIVNNITDDAILANGSPTAMVVGVGNAWQVLGEEVRCRSRYGNFNRMYLPMNMPTYANSTFKYDKITILYEHNWPTSTGIAPAGTINEVVIYLGDSSDALELNDFPEFEATFRIALASNEEFTW